VLNLMGPLRDSRILDVGCGDGALLCTTASRGSVAIGVDPDPAMVTAARSRAREMGVSVTLLQGSVERLAFPDATFDVVTAVTVLCFVSDVAGAVREMARVLRPGGLLVLGELGRWSLWAMNRRVRGWLGSATWKAAHFWSAAELCALAEQAGLSVNTIHGGAFYPPIGALARIMAPVDSWLGRRTNFGAAFIALRGVLPGHARGY
jgi:ubiquinone/menaquinone biosynthesis C-methylase UbiE